MEPREHSAAEKALPETTALPRFCDPSKRSKEVGQRWDRGWLLGWRDICRNTDERTVIASVVPRRGTDFTLRIGFPSAIESLAAPASSRT